MASIIIYIRIQAYDYNLRWGFMEKIKIIFVMPQAYTLNVADTKKSLLVPSESLAWLTTQWKQIRS